MRHAVVSACVLVILAVQVCQAKKKAEAQADKKPAADSAAVQTAPASAEPAASADTSAPAAVEPAAQAAGPLDTSAAEAKKEEQKAPVAEPAKPKEPTAAELRKKGDQLATKGKTQEAMEAYRQCLEKSDPKDTANSRVSLSLGTYCYEKKQYGDALGYFARVTGKAAEQASFKIMQAGALHMTGKSDAAIVLLAPLAADPKQVKKPNSEAFRILGDAFVRSGKTDSAALWYGKYLSLGGTKTADMAYLVALAEERTAPAKAKLSYERNIKSYPNDCRNYLRLGRMLAESKATQEKAIGLLRKAAALADTVPLVWLDIGAVYARLGKKDDAIGAYRSCLKADGANVEAKRLLGVALMDKGAVADAIPYLEEAYRQQPDGVAPMAALAAAYVKTGAHRKSIDLLVKVTAAAPRDLQARKLLVEAYRETGQDEAAIKEIRAALEIERDRALLQAGGALLVKQGKYDDAVVMLEEALGSNPENIEALMLLAKSKRGQNKDDEAIEVYKEINIIDTKYAPAMCERADMYLVRGQAKWAESFYQRALAADPGYALAEVGLAKLARMWGKADLVNQHLQKAALMAPNDPMVKKAIEDVKNPPKAKKDEVRDDKKQENVKADEGPGKQDKASRKEERKRKRGDK